MSNLDDIRRYQHNLRALSLWSSSITLIQSVIWISLNIIGILLYNCVITPSIQKSNYMQYIQDGFSYLYFENNCSAHEMGQATNFSKLAFTKILEPQQIFIWNCVYLSVTVCWLIISIVLLFNALKYNMKLFTMEIIIWIIFAIIISIFDTALGIIFAIDSHNIQKTYGNNSSLEAEHITVYFLSLLMMILMFKGFILWLMNFGFIIALSKRLSIIIRKVGGLRKLLGMRNILNSSTYMKTAPIDAYEDSRTQQQPLQSESLNECKSTGINNDAYETDTINIIMPNEMSRPSSIALKSNSMVNASKQINENMLERVAHISHEVESLAKYFRNIDSYIQYVPNDIMDTTERSKTIETTTTTLPLPDYSPQFHRANYKY